MKFQKKLHTVIIQLFTQLQFEVIERNCFRVVQITE